MKIATNDKNNIKSPKIVFKEIQTYNQSGKYQNLSNLHLQNNEIAILYANNYWTDYNHNITLFGGNPNGYCHILRKDNLYYLYCSINSGNSTRVEVTKGSLGFVVAQVNTSPYTIMAYIFKLI